ncbi:acyl-CoA N-acyltransferase [Podospora didyma]|uniref:Acyl-CoA N-acyltransferase n=1 Tax=Podospora didyma TaxID=330526 RepID=A0AAE0NUS0_9PEZI|nr:acyl-CoA N-acyltransferase [Podospora didyma]
MAATSVKAAATTNGTTSPPPTGAAAALNFRLAVESDAPQLIVLVQSAYRGAASRQGWTTEADLLSGNRIDLDGLVTKITAPDSAVILAFSTSGEMVACCEVVKNGDDVAYFGMFAVDPTKQAGGIGRQVLGYAEEWVRAQWQGVAKMEMTVIFTRKELIAWYGRRGYRTTGERREFPYEEIRKIGGKDSVGREDLWFEVLEKDL